MITIKENRCYANQATNDQDQNWIKKVTRAQISSEYRLVLAQTYADALSVPCPQRDCLAAVQAPCTGLTRYNIERTGPHYERLIVLAYCLRQENNNLIKHNPPPANV